ncbi:FecR domain-containing protein, partial [Chloroflexota bacterium]
MENNTARILEECIERLRRGESVEDCLAKYPKRRGEIEPLLNMVHSVSCLPRVSLSDEFQSVAKARLMSRIRQQGTGKRTTKAKPQTTIIDGLKMISQQIWQPVLQVKRVAIPVTLALMLVLAVIFAGVPYFTSPTPALASQSTLSILSGTVEIQCPGEDRSQRGNDGEVLDVGTLVKTGSGSHALLTFSEGSTVKLDPNTTVEIQQVEFKDEQPVTIVLTQWLGRTWSRVVKMVDPGSHYRIETPSATAIVRGTLFSTEVAETGDTRVATTEGLVSVVAQGEEVYLPANQQTQIETGAAPSQPETLPDPNSEITITIDRPAIVSVTDPTSSSTGMLPGGESYNQIPSSQASSPSEAAQVINISEPIDGEYIIALRYLDKGVAEFTIQGKTRDTVIFEYTGKWGGSKDSGWLIHLNLNVDDGYIIGGEINTSERMGDKSPEKGILGLDEDEPLETESTTSGDTANGEETDEDDLTSVSPS